MNKKFCAAAAAILLCGTKCFADREPYNAQLGLISVGGFVVFFNSQGPLSFLTLTPRDLPADAVDAGEVFCRSCQHGLSVPTAVPYSGSRSTNISGAQGDGSFKRAVKELLRTRPELRGIYDVKIDTQRISILGVYKRVCTEVSARGFK